MEEEIIDGTLFAEGLDTEIEAIQEAEIVEEVETGDGEVEPLEEEVI